METLTAKRIAKVIIFYVFAKNKLDKNKLCRVNY